MGRPKIKVIDDSQPTVEVKNQKSKVKSANNSAKVVVDDLVAQINAQLGIMEEPAKKEAKEASVKKEGLEKTKKPETPKKSKPAQATKSKPRSKKYQKVVKEVDKSKSYSLNEAVDLVKKLSYSKFDGTLEAHINTTQTGIRGLVPLPYASGKKLHILAFGKGASQSGADKVGDEASIEEINKGKIDFDLLLTTPEWMPKLAKVAKNLGPRGLMPNPKSGTITEDLKKAVESFQAGKTEYKTESKAPVMHLGLGKLTQPSEELAANIKILLQTIGKTRIKKVTLSPTMGPSVKVDLGSI